MRYAQPRIPGRIRTWYVSLQCDICHCEVPADVISQEHYGHLTIDSLLLPQSSSSNLHFSKQGYIHAKEKKRPLDTRRPGNRITPVLTGKDGQQFSGLEVATTILESQSHSPMSISKPKMNIHSLQCYDPSMTGTTSCPADC